jgi:hypothetical protein
MGSVPLADSARSNEPRASTVPRLAYLLAASHSGSTLLAMLLGAQPGACTVGELKATSLDDSEEYRCSCQQPIRRCRFWEEISAAMAGRGFLDFDITRAGTSISVVDSGYARRLMAPLYRGPALEMVRDFCLLLSPAWRKHLKESTRRNVALIQSLLSATGGSVVVDSSKIALRLKYLLRVTSLDIRVIRVIRDGRAVSLTYTDEWNFADSSDPALRGGGSGARRPPPRRSMTEAANEWKRSNEASDLLLAQLPRHQWTEVRYEELCANPEATVRRLASFLGLDPAETVLDFRSREQHVIGNGMRMDSNSEIRLDERWRDELSSAQLHMFDAVAGDLNRRYGYR